MGTLRTAQGVGWGRPIASASGAGGREPRALCGRPGVYARRQRALRTWASVRVVKISGVRPASRRVPLHASPAPFSQGLPGSMQRVVPPSRRSQDRTAVAVNSGPVSERRELGGPGRTKRAVRRARTSSDRRWRAPAMLRHARVCASTRVRTRSGRPSCVRSRTKASDQTWWGRAARRRGLRGTRRPSWRQRRSPRLWFTRQPSARSRAVMRREPERPNRRARVLRRAIQAGAARGHPGRAPRRAARRGAHPTGPPLRDGHDGSHVHARLPPARRAQTFPEDTACKLAVSRAWSATSRWRRAFSRSRALRRFA